MIKKTAAGLALVAAAALALSACGGSDSKKDNNGSGGGGGGGGGTGGGGSTKVLTSYNPQDYDNVKDGGKLTLPLIEIPTQMNPFQGNGDLYTSHVAWFYQPNLSYSDPKGTIAYNPDYVTAKQKVVKGNTVVTYDLNPKAKWNDGTAMGWKDFLNTWKANNASNDAYVVGSSDGYVNMSSVKEGKNARQAVVTYRGVYPYWNYMFGGLINPHIASPDAFNKAYVDNPHSEWGAGPFVVSKWDAKGGTIILKRNPKWWGKKAKLDQVTWSQLDPTAAVNSFKNGQVDATDVSIADRLNQVKGMSGIDLRRGTTTANALLTFNAKTPQLTDTNVRKALMEGVDRAKIAQITFQGLDYTEALPGSFNLFPFQAGYQDNFGKVVTYNADQAKKDLDAAGWKAGSGGIRAKGGQKLSLDYVWVGESPTAKARATALAQMMKGIGVQLNLKNRPTSDFQKIITDRSFDVLSYGYIAGSSNGMAFICQVYCSNSNLNESSSTPKSFDKDVKKVADLPTVQGQITAGNKVELQALQHHGIMPLYNGPTIIATKKGLANYGVAQFYGNYGEYGPPEMIGWQK